MRRLRRQRRTELDPGAWAEAISRDPVLRAQMIGRVRARATELTPGRELDETIATVETLKR